MNADKSVAATKPAHTPGPWEVDFGDQTRSTEILKGTAVIADVHSHIAFEDSSHQDAKLIAAAPDLLKALQGMLAAYPYIPNNDVRAAEAAILKATVGAKSEQAASTLVFHLNTKQLEVMVFRLQDGTSRIHRLRGGAGGPAQWSADRTPEEWVSLQGNSAEYKATGGAQ